MITLREVIEILNTIDIWRQEIRFLFGAIKEGSKETAFQLDLEGKVEQEESIPGGGQKH